MKISAKPDKALAHDQLQALQALLKVWGAPFFMQSMFWILAKKKHAITGVESSRVIPFQLNKMQLDMDPKLALRNLVIKMRQGGATTYFALRRLLLPAITEEGIGGLLISQNSEKAIEHFQIIRRAYDLIGANDPRGRDEDNKVCVELKQHLLHTRFRSKRELFFDVLDSRIRVATAEIEESGQGITLHHILASEYARWPGQPRETLSNVMGALVPGGTLDKESTANGAGGPFFEDVMVALSTPDKSDATLHVYPWWWDEGYRENLSKKELKELREDLQRERDNKEEEDARKEELLLMEKFKLDLNQIAWRRNTMIAQKGNFLEKYPEDVITAFLLSGNQYFDKKILAARKLEIIGEKPWNTYSNGQAVIFKPKVPGRRYLIAGDPASGRAITNSDTDYCAAVVLDLETGEEFAWYRARVRPEEFAADLAALGIYYENAVIAVERTGDGGTVILALQGENKYSNIFKFKEWTKRNRGKLVEYEGFPTTGKTRPVALNMLSRFICTHPELIHDPEFINEALVFVRDERGIPAAMQGLHDDRVSCRWIAHYVRLVLLGYYVPWEARGEKYQDAERFTEEELGAVA